MARGRSGAHSVSKEKEKKEESSMPKCPGTTPGKSLSILTLFIGAGRRRRAKEKSTHHKEYRVHREARAIQMLAQTSIPAKEVNTHSANEKQKHAR